MTLTGQSAQGVTVRHGDQTDHHVTSYDTTRSPTASDVTSPTVTNRTSSTGSSTATTPTGLNTNATTKTFSGQQSNVGSSMSCLFVVY